MKNNSRIISSTIIFVAIALALLNPFHVWMPEMMVATMLVIAFVAFGAFVTFILFERAGDERETAHRTLAGRHAFLVGSGMLLIGIGYQGYKHAVDPWLVATLVVMVIVKLATRAWSDRNM